MKRKPSYQMLVCSFIIVLLLSMFFSVSLGRYPMSGKEILGMLWSRIVPMESFWSQTQEALFFEHRLPRILLACMVGCSLSVAGSSYQCVFQNPMASPDILGASSGAALGAALAILLHGSSTLVSLSAFFMSLVTVFLVLLIGQNVRGKQTLGLVLAGIMMSSLTSSGTSMIKLVADPQDQLPSITYWLMGSLNGAKPLDIWTSVFPMLLGTVPLLLLRWRINVLSLGDEEAMTMGVNTRRLRTLVILCSTLLTAASVSVSGLIGWVGLVIPHWSRRLVGDDFRKLLPISALMGALFLLLVDDLSRNLFATEIPIGILTAVIGAPCFLWILAKGGDRI